MLLRPERVVPVRKSLQLVGLGMAFNAIPTFIEGEKFRPLGVLHRHGLSTILLNNVVSPEFRNSPAFPALLTGLWYFLSVYFADRRRQPFGVQAETAQQKFDAVFFKGRQYEADFDPEGLLGALMTAVTIWSGSWFMQNSPRFTDTQVFLLGAGLLGSGTLLARVAPNYAPISKPLWTPTFVLASNGWTILKYLLVKVAIPYLPLAVTNALAVVGKCNLETYFLGELSLLALRYEFAEGRSFWTIARSWLYKFCSPAVSQLLLTAAFDASLVAFAFLCNAKGWKIRLL
ncbi:hypothetical protein PICMEDRAFT_14784 [Pichia membranifaciens NRRL Y-2026]|uniref:Uncharacterized protein n=1 Tax=Pichia membranifaciens NRRL Y-2026 TaxID=763406 RepID=A0A1E3NT83_9ASCO|nr:hypothetical protein PICMEDRAFT_14784 [Pichia membranifaciens NRRL Y-2026]ODQ49319.1 hypothetical protein PICMEDRAFT_14784 [Pichia membranifaciens NRRL Y-2026]